MSYYYLCVDNIACIFIWIFFGNVTYCNYLSRNPERGVFVYRGSPEVRKGVFFAWKAFPKFGKGYFLIKKHSRSSEITVFCQKYHFRNPERAILIFRSISGIRMGVFLCRKIFPKSGISFYRRLYFTRDNFVLCDLTVR